MTSIKFCGQSHIRASLFKQCPSHKPNAMSAKMKLEKTIYYPWSITIRAVDFSIKIHFSLELFVFWAQLFRMTYKIDFFSCTVCVESHVYASSGKSAT